MRTIFGFIGAFSFLYGLACLPANRLNTGILAFMAIGIVFMFAAKYLSFIQSYLMRRKIVRNAFFIIITMGIASAAYFEASILWGMKEQHPQNMDYIVILGAGVKNGKPTPVLKTRLQKAIKEHEKYPQAKIFVTGGLDPGEKKTEAEVMKEFLVEHGVDASLVVTENKATSTEENFAFTKELMSIQHPEVIVVTSNYHLYRAKYYAKKVGMEPYSAGAGIPLSIVPLTHMREILAVGFMVIRDVV